MVGPKKMKVREKKAEEEEEVDNEEVEDEEETQDETEEDKQIVDNDTEEQIEIEERKGPKKNKIREKVAGEEEEVEDDEVEDEEVQEDKQVTRRFIKNDLILTCPKKKKVRQKVAEEEEEVKDDEVDDEEVQKDKQILQRFVKSNFIFRCPIMKRVREKKAEEEEDEVEDEEVQEDKQVTDEESEEESKPEEKGKKNGFMSVLHLVGPKMKRVREKEEEDKRVTDEESEEESETEEKEKERLKRKIAIKWKEEASERHKSPKKIKMEEQTEKKISNEKSNHQFSLALDEDDEEDSEDDMELKYDSDGSLIDDDGKCGAFTHPSTCQLSPEEQRKLEKLFIQLKHEVLPQHKIEKIAGTRALSKEEKAEFEKYAELRTGKYLPHENKKLRRNWKDFCIANEWDVNNPRPFLQMRYKNKVEFIDFKERMKFIQFLANGLDNRSLYSVFNRFKVLYYPHKVSRYSTREDDIIMDYIRRYKLSDHERDRKFAELASILKRTRASVWRRYRVLKKKRNIPDDP